MAVIIPAAKSGLSPRNNDKLHIIPVADSIYNAVYDLLGKIAEYILYNKAYYFL